MTLSLVDPNPPCEEIIEQLRSLLSMAEAGEIQGLVSIALYSDGSVSHGCQMRYGPDTSRLIGETVMASHQMAQSEIQKRVDDYQQ